MVTSSVMLGIIRKTPLINPHYLELMGKMLNPLVKASAQPLLLTTKFIRKLRNCCYKVSTAHHHPHCSKLPGKRSYPE